VSDRIIGSYTEERKGPLLVIFGAMHGNEPAGVKAIQLIIKMLEVEPITNPKFQFNGKLLGLIGNLAAYKSGKRFIEKDLNRNWKTDLVSEINQKPSFELDTEEKEISELLEILRKEIKENPQYTEMVVLDLHTTSSFGGIFIIPSEQEKSLALAKKMYAPVVKGFLEGIQGTTLHFFNNTNFDIETTAITFESGQHNEELAVNRAIAAVVNLMRTIQMVNEDDVENVHDELLISHSEHLPEITELIQRHPIEESDQFVMLPNFENFQKVNKDQVLASDKSGPIRAPEDCMILMPLYQNQGEDGFFLVKQIQS